jgi:hypothetical protein
MNRHPRATPRHRPRQRGAQPEPVRERANRVQPDMGHDPGTARFNLHTTSAGNVHPGSALLVVVLYGFEHLQNPTSEGLFRAPQPIITTSAVKNQG